MQLARRLRPWRWRWQLLLPKVPDVVGLLVAQSEICANGMEAFEAWSTGGGAESAAAVRDAEHRGYEARRDLLRALQAALSTPVDQEDLYVLSERVDRVLTEARYVVREAEVLEWSPDTHAEIMGERLATGAQALSAGFRSLRKHPDEAGRQADVASAASRDVERQYRVAMGARLSDDDLRAVLAAQDLYRRYQRVAEAVVAVADRLWYSVLRGA